MNPTSYNVIKDTSGLRPMGDPEDRAAMDKLSVEGKVVQRAECCPNNSSLYSAIKKDAYGETAGQTCDYQLQTSS